jgi:antitoxin ParD1/3/4
MPAMNISMTPELMKIVQAKVKSGLYNNASEVIRDAVRRMDANAEVLYQLKVERLKEALAQGLKEVDEGDVSEYSYLQLKKDLGRKK